MLSQASIAQFYDAAYSIDNFIFTRAVSEQPCSTVWDLASTATAATSTSSGMSTSSSSGYNLSARRPSTSTGVITLSSSGHYGYPDDLATGTYLESMQSSSQPRLTPSPNGATASTSPHLNSGPFTYPQHAMNSSNSYPPHVLSNYSYDERPDPNNQYYTDDYEASLPRTASPHFTSDPTHSGAPSTASLTSAASGLYGLHPSFQQSDWLARQAKRPRISYEPDTDQSRSVQPKLWTYSSEPTVPISRPGGLTRSNTFTALNRRSNQSHRLSEFSYSAPPRSNSSSALHAPQQTLAQHLHPQDQGIRHRTLNSEDAQANNNPVMRTYTIPASPALSSTSSSTRLSVRTTSNVTVPRHGRTESTASSPFEAHTPIFPSNSNNQEAYPLNSPVGCSTTGSLDRGHFQPYPFDLLGAPSTGLLSRSAPPTPQINTFASDHPKAKRTPIGPFRLTAAQADAASWQSGTSRQLSPPPIQASEEPHTISSPSTIGTELTVTPHYLTRRVSRSSSSANEPQLASPPYQASPALGPSSSIPRRPSMTRSRRSSIVDAPLSQSVKETGRRSSARHSREKIHGCPEEGCTRAFRRLEHLRRHERTHTMERPYQCDWPECPKFFSRSDNLTQHRKTHENKLRKQEEAKALKKRQEERNPHKRKQA